MSNMPQENPDLSPIPSEEHKLSLFEKMLPLTVAICMAIGIILSVSIPGLNEWLDTIKIGDTNILIAICLFLMMYPALLNLQASELKKVVKHPKAIGVTLISNWIIAPLLHLALARIFLADYPELIVAVILLGASPCTAMVLVWGALSGANQEQNFINTSLNTITIVFLYAPVVKLLTGMQNIQLDWVQLVLSVAIFIGLPLIAGVVTRKTIIPAKGNEWFEKTYRPIIGKVAIGALLFTLIVLFSMNGQTMINNPKELVLVSIPLLLLYPIIVGINMAVTKAMKFKYREAATTIIIGSSSHFEIAIATAVGLYGVASQVALGTTMGLFWEVPIMLSLTYFLKYLRKKKFFYQGKNEFDSDDLKNPPRDAIL
jgi:ACR3 family arsenite transporter